jgi:hypothetical protein
MNRLDLPYVLVTACVGVALFGAGRWSAPTPQAKVVYVAPPLVTAVSEPIPPPPAAPVVAPVTTVDQLPVYTVSGGAAPAPVGTIGDDLLPIKKAAPPVVSVSHPVASAPVVTPVAAPKAPPPPMTIVLEEVPDNPYKPRPKHTVAQTPGF